MRSSTSFLVVSSTALRVGALPLRRPLENTANKEKESAAQSVVSSSSPCSSAAEVDEIEFLLCSSSFLPYSSRCVLALRSCFPRSPSFFNSLTMSRRYIQQHRDDILSTHGASLVRHQSIADKNVSSKVPTGVHQVAAALPAADLFHTKVQEGMGTSEKDPYDRTLPNMESIPPETTVLYSAAILAPNQEEIEEIPRVWHLLSVWWHDEHPRMPLFLEKQRIANALPVSPVAEGMLHELPHRVLPSLSSNPEEVAHLQQWWASAQETYHTCARQHVLEKYRFMTELQRTHDHAMRSIEGSTGKEQFTMALEVLRRKAIITHNNLLEAYYYRLFSSSSAAEEGSFKIPSANTMWDTFLEYAKIYKQKIFVKTTDSPLLYAWEALLVEKNIRPPSMTAPVALFVALVTLQLKQQATSTTREGQDRRAISSSSTSIPPGSEFYREEKEKVGWNDTVSSNESGFASAAISSSMRRYQRYVSVLTRRRYVMEELVEIFHTTPEDLQRLAKKFHTYGELELARDLAMCAEMLNNTELLKTEATSMLPPFSSTSEVKSVFASIYAGKDEDAKQHLCRTLCITTPPSARGRQINWENVLEEVDWKNTWKSLVVTLLMYPPFLSTVHTYIKNAIAAKGVERELFHPNVVEQLDRIKQARAARDESCKRKANELILKLSSYEWVDHTLQFLLEMEIPEPSDNWDVTPTQKDRTLASLERRQTILESEAVAAKEEEEQATKPHDPLVSPVALVATFQAIQARHPQWVKSGVLPCLTPPMKENTNQERDANGTNEASSMTPADEYSTLLQYFVSDPFAGLRVLTRIFIRLAYVPQAGAAMIAQRTRRRIGPVGLKPTEFNIPTEFGIVEQFDNLLYKRYDWQGWYQRMVDMHNRNVSLRCRLDDLKRLDAYGNPFVDLQTERRLRILCGERVGMGVLKLDSDKYEDQGDNITYGVTKLSEILADSRKAQLGMEYWPTVEVKVRRPSGQSQAYYSLLDDDRIEAESKALYQKYKELKKSSLFVTPMNLWLKTKATQSHQKVNMTDEEGYSVASLHASLNEEDSDSKSSWGGGGEHT